MEDLIDFTYEDTDSFQNEICELYSYGEESEFLANRTAFEESMEDSGLPLAWKHMVPKQQSRAINYLLTNLDVACRNTRIKSCRALAYLIQGNFGECLSLEEQANFSRDNVFMLYEQGIFQAFVQQLIIEADVDLSGNYQNSAQSSISSSQIYQDSSELRLILSVLGTITEVMYHAKNSDDARIIDLRKQFVSELQMPYGDEILVVSLFQMLNKFCSGLAAHYPIRKITLLIWKIILITLGGSETLRNLKERNRELCDLDPKTDDTIEITKNIRPCSPPQMPSDAQARNRTALTSGFGANKRKVFKQTAFDDALTAYKESLLNSLVDLDPNEAKNPDEDGDADDEQDSDCSKAAAFEERTIDLTEPVAIEKIPTPEESSSDSGIMPDEESEPSDRAPSPPSEKVEHVTTDLDEDEETEIDNNLSASNDRDAAYFPQTGSILYKDHSPDCNKSDAGSQSNRVDRSLPWSPKVRKADLSMHMSNTRQKFLGYTLKDDLETTFGLPDPIIEGIKVMKKHMYTSLSEIQSEREEAIDKYPLTHGELDRNYQEAPAEALYAALLPKLPQYMISLLKILLAAASGPRLKQERAESINIVCESSSNPDSLSMVQIMKMATDTSRHKEVVIKAVSAILILLLKHFKVNHIYQFEYVAQQLMFANCIPLILKFLSQDIYTYIVNPKSSISAIDFPACVIGEQPELTTEAIDLFSFQPYSWRNMFSCINLVRVLNKLTKWKNSRIMMLVVFKSAPTLTKALNVKHSLFQLYVLKLLKVQLKFLGRPWKKINMKLISAIYQKVRHRLNDDWAYSNDIEAKPWDFQIEEFTLQTNITKFHRRRYQNILAPNCEARVSLMLNRTAKYPTIDDFNDDYEMNNQTGSMELYNVNHISPQFEKSYEKWLNSEVFDRNIDWDLLIST